MTAAGLTGCGGDTGSSQSSSEGQEMYTIGISQFAEHGSLDNCREGFIQGLEEEGLVEGENLEIKVNNADADTGTAAQIADTFVADKVDLICAIATPSAQAAYNSARNTDIPVVYTAVTNPEEAQLADDEGMPVGAVTGTSDQLPVEAQLAMIREILPDAETIGILYTTSEANSAYSITQYEKYAEEYGFTLETAGVTNTSEVSLAAASLLDKVDCLTNLTDNTVVSALPTILDQANEKNIPVFGSEIEQVKLGCLAAEGLDYVNLGIETGKSIRLRGKGMPGASGALAGDLLLKVTVGSRPGFERKGMDVYSTAAVPFATAVLGGEVMVQTIHGAVMCKIKAGTQSGSKIRLRGKGIVSMNDPSKQGDHYVTVQIQVPVNLGNEAKEKLREFQAACSREQRRNHGAA